MNRREAQEILSASRPDGSDDSDPLVAEARKAAESDPFLREWLRQERSVDQALKKKMSSVPVPAEIRTQALGENPVIRAAFWKRPVALLALAACLAGMVSLTLFYSTPKVREVLAWNSYLPQTVSIAKHLMLLSYDSADLNDIQNWLENSQSPSNFSIPAKLQALTALGCKSLDIGGNQVSLICFKLNDGKTEAHLFVVDRSALQQAPPENSPVFDRANHWTTASWSDQTHVYVLASKASPEDLKSFF